jgi:hypothetical protein
MPVELGVDQQGRRILTGYLDVSSGTTIADPAGNVIVVADVAMNPGTSPQWGLEAQPSLRGEPSASYSLPAGRWLPARPEMVAPDGYHFAYKSPDGSLHLVDAASSADQAVANPNGLDPIGYTKAGVWLIHGGTNDGTGLWLLDPATKAIAPVLPANPKQNWEWLRAGAIWGLDSSGLPGSPPASALVHFDLQSKTAADWYSQPGATVTLAAVDANGAALLLITKGSSGPLVAVTAAGTSVPVAPPAGAVATDLGGRMATDAHGGWIIGTGVYLFAGTKMTRIGPGTAPEVTPAGECR